jgi:hypothetical protein
VKVDAEDTGIGPSEQGFAASITFIVYDRVAAVSQRLAQLQAAQFLPCVVLTGLHLVLPLASHGGLA